MLHSAEVSDGGALNLRELSSECGMSAPELTELVDYGALLPLPETEDCPSERHFNPACVAALCTAGKLRRDFDLDLFAIAFLLGYLLRIEALEAQLDRVQAA
jgi:chaperone modulatory protein CbpM